MELLLNCNLTANAVFVMNARQANEISLTDLLQRLGHDVKVSEQGGTQLTYLSPWRAESEPSLSVKTSANVWFDHGESEGGDVLDFAKMYLRKKGRVASSSEGLKWLADTMGYSTRSLFSSKQQKDFSEKSETSRALKLLKTAPLRSKTIFQYLAGRGIPQKLAQQYLCLVQYQNIKKPRDGGYYGFGQKNIAGGYEIRAATDQSKFKSALIKRDITLHKGRVGEGLCIFEGFLDHLSLLAILKVESLNNDAIILNGASCYERAKKYISENSYSKIDSFLDNDSTGDKITAKFKREFGDKVIDHRHTYEGFKDLNEALRKNQPPSFSPPPNEP